MNWKPPDKSQQRMNPEICDVDYGERRRTDAYVVWDYHPEGEVIFYSQYEHAMEQMQQRITYLENVCNEHMRMLTGD